MRTKKQIVLTLLATLLLSACQTTKYVPDGEHLLYTVKFETDNKAIKSSDLQTYLRQAPNPKVFDFIPFNLGMYSLSSPDTALWINRFLRKVGDEPVIYDSTLTESSEDELKKYMANKGYYNANVTSDVTYKKKKAKVTYKIKSGTPYTIGSFRYAIKDPKMRDYVLADSAKTLVKVGANFDSDVLESERNRVTKILRNNGYFEFTKDFVAVMADSTIGDHKVDVTMFIKPNKKIVAKDQYEIEPHYQFTLRNVTYYALSDITIPLDTSAAGVLHKTSYKGVDVWTDTRLTRPKALYRKTFLEEDSLFNENKVDLTYAKMTALHMFKNQNIYFSPASDSTKHQLDCNVVVTPDKVQSFSVQVEGTNNEGDFGLAGKVTYTHGNIFRGGEQFKFSLGGGNQSIITKRSIWDVNTEASLTFPIMLLPGLKRNFILNTTASTEVYVNFSYQTRQDYVRNIAGTGIRYRWFKTSKLIHQLDLIDFNYVYLPYKSEEFQKTINQSLLKYSYEDHFILRIGYAITYSTQKVGVYRNNYSLRAAVETGGNILYGICAAANAPKNENGSYIIGNIPFSEYVKTDFDFCFRNVIDSKNTVAYHFGLGVALPYGNSNTLPFEKRYYAGGANSVRGWSARSLGPGNYTATDNVDYMKQSGDISLNLNVEYRTLLFWKLELAAFLDAGNIWTINDENSAEGQFKWDRFYKQIAFGYGIGLRLNFDFFVVRLDWGLKAFDPAKPAGQQWRFVPGWDITKDTALHFAVGYPF